jgi:hypothetical protein
VPDGTSDDVLYAVCLGGALIDRGAARRGDVEAIAAQARRVLSEVTEAARPC